MVAATRRIVRPVPVDQVHVQLAADQRAQALRDARACEHVEALRGQVPDARAPGRLPRRRRTPGAAPDRAPEGPADRDPSDASRRDPRREVGELARGGVGF